MAKKAWETGLIGRPEPGEITLSPYDPAWPKTFEEQAKTIAGALGSTALRIEHIGSTAVPGLTAKPIIDILVVVPDSADESMYLPQLEAVGYVLRVREPGWNEHRMFRTPARDVHVHIYSSGCSEIERTLKFRDCLRGDATQSNRYARTKRELAARQWPDMDTYASAKSEVIEEILGKLQF